MIQHILKCFNEGFKGKLLLLGDWIDLEHGLILAAWDTLRIRDIAMDPKFVKLDGDWVRHATIREVFDQFAGPYDVIAINVPKLSRDLFFSDQVQVHLAKVIIMHHEGRDQEILNRAEKLGYNLRRLERDWMLMSR